MKTEFLPLTIFPGYQHADVKDAEAREAFEGRFHAIAGRFDYRQAMTAPQPDDTAAVQRFRSLQRQAERLFLDVQLAEESSAERGVNLASPRQRARLFYLLACLHAARYQWPEMVLLLGDCVTLLYRGGELYAALRVQEQRGQVAYLAQQYQVALACFTDAKRRIENGVIIIAGGTPQPIATLREQDYTDILCSVTIERAGVLCTFGDFDAAQHDVTEALALLERWRQTKMPPATATDEGEEVSANRLPLHVLQHTGEEVQRWVDIHLRVRQHAAYLKLWKEKLSAIGSDETKLAEAFQEAMGAAADSAARPHPGNHPRQLYGLAAEIALTLSATVTAEQRVIWLEQAETALELAWKHAAADRHQRFSDPHKLRRIYGVRADDIAHLQLLELKLHGLRAILTEVRERIDSALADIETFGAQAAEAGMKHVAAATNTIRGDVERLVHRHSDAQKNYEHAKKELTGEPRHEQFHLRKLEAEQGHKQAQHAATHDSSV